MSGRGGGHNRRRKRGGESFQPQPPGKPQPPVDETSPVVQAFRGYQSELDTRHDKYERIVKLSRDITIESKRTIFLLHTVVGSPLRDEILSDVRKKIVELQKTKFHALADELVNEDAYQFTRAYSPGMQEYIEAVSFYHYILTKDLVTYDQVQTELVFSKEATVNTQNDEKMKDLEGKEPSSKSDAQAVLREEGSSTPVETQDVTEKPGVSSEKPSCASVSVRVTQMDYVLGLADLTGELMRMAISSVGNGDLEVPFQLCNFLRQMYDNFSSLGHGVREVNRKMHTLRQSLHKVENACYTLEMRGSEIPKHMLVDILCSSSVDNADFQPDNPAMMDT